jgi:hypothetical protein
MDRNFIKRTGLSVTVVVAIAVWTGGGREIQAQSQARSQYPPLVPGTGLRIDLAGDDFEDPAWTWEANLPKVFNNKDTALSQNYPLGIAANRRWYEGIKRGQPDIVQRIETPPDGLPGSTGALAIRSLATGGQRPTYQQQQEDFIANVAGTYGKIPVEWSPSVVTRVWLPPVEQWENRTGCHFAFRLSLETDPRSMPRGSARPADFDGTFWPGMFIHFDSREGSGATGQANDRISIWMKAGNRGEQLNGPELTTTGWWTLGMSVTPDGCVHYFARPGVEPLTADDWIASAWPFGYRAERLKTFFFNVCNGDDGRNWSTWFVVDDPFVYAASPAQAANGNPAGNPQVR